MAGSALVPAPVPPSVATLRAVVVLARPRTCEGPPAQPSDGPGDWTVRHPVRFRYRRVGGAAATAGAADERTARPATTATTTDRASRTPSTRPSLPRRGRSPRSTTPR